MKTSLYIFIVLFLGVQISAEAQILKELRKAVKEAAEEVVRELDKNGREKEAVVQAGEETSKAEEAVPGATKAAAEEEGTNFYEEGTRRELFGKSEGFKKISEDGRYAATSGFEGTRQAIFINGKPGAHFDKLHTGTFKFSRKGGHFAYIGERAGECILVVDGKEVESVDCNRVREFSDSVVFSNDGTVVVYVKEQSGDSKTVVINGKAGPDFYRLNGKMGLIDNDVYYMAGFKPEGPYDPLKFYLYKNHTRAYETPVSNFLISAEQDLVLGGKPEAGKEDWIIYNGEKIKGSLLPHLGMHPRWGAIFYTDGQENFVRWKERVYSIPRDEIIYAPLEIHALSFFPSPDGKRNVFISRKDMSTYRVWMDGKPGPPFQDIQDLKFTADSENLIYFANSGGKWFIVKNGVEEGPFERVSDLQVAENGGSYSYFIHENNKMKLYLNGKFVDIAAYHNGFKFSPDGSRYAFLEGENSSLVVDGEKVVSEGKPVHPSPLPSRSKYGGGKSNYFVFSPTGNLAYIHALNFEGKVLVYGDQEVRTKGDSSEFSYLTFSPNGEHFAFFKSVPGTGSDGAEWRLYIDMKPGPVVSEWGHELAPEPIQFLDNDNVQVIGYLGEDIVSHTVKIP